MNTVTRSMLLLGALLLSACELTPQRTGTSPSFYDLGTPEPGEVRPCCEGRIALATVRSAAMLTSQTMWYREGDNSVQPKAFAISRWSTAPAALLEQYVRIALGVAEADRPDALPYRLALQLEVMEQQFPSAETSRAHLVVSASMSRTADRSLLANRVFSLDAPTPSADPLGGAIAMSSLASTLVTDLQTWMCEVIDDDD